MTRLEKGGWNCLTANDISFFFFYINQCEYIFHMNSDQINHILSCNGGFVPWLAAE